MSTLEINIHEYPENATQRQLADYRHAVECAVLEGRKLELFSENWNRWTSAQRVSLPLPWNWGRYRYRIARDPLGDPNTVIMRMRYAPDGGLEYDSISLDGGRTWQPFRQEVVS
jgi:hypothetical protein